MRCSLSVVLLSLMFLPTAQADGELHADFVAIVEAEGLGADLRVLQRVGAADTPAGFDLQAESLRVETDRRTVWTGVAGTPVETTTSGHSDARVTGSAVRMGGLLFVTAHGDGARLGAADGSCGRVESAPDDQFLHAPALDGRADVRVPLSDAVSWKPCTDADVAVRGDLLLVLWSWDARLVSDQGTTDLQSGRGEPTGGDAGASELFLFARNATLTLPAAPQSLYVEALSATAGDVRLGGAEGQIHGDAVQGDLHLAGRVDVLVRGRGAGRPMAVTVGGTIDEALLDDRSLAVPGDGWGGWPLLATSAGLVGVVGLQRVRPHLHYLHAERTGGELGSLVPQTLRQRRAVGLWIMARHAETRRRYRTSRRRASRANELFRPFPEAQFTRAVAAAELGHHADAMTDFLDLYHRYDDPMGRAAAACGMAQQCCRLRKWDVGQEWLLMAAAESLQYAQRASRSPEFHHYDGEPWFDALRRGEDVASASGRSRPSADPSIH